jgi:DNA-binding CsgD family transcriptional regulator
MNRRSADSNTPVDRYRAGPERAEMPRDRVLVVDDSTPPPAGDRAGRSSSGVMDFDRNSAAALLAALRLAADSGSAAAALAAAGIELPVPERLAGVARELSELLGEPTTGDCATEALALGFLAGRVAHRPRCRTLQDPTSFVMDQHLVVRAADGESILRLPWFEEGLFVGRQLPEIVEMPAPVRKLCIDHYSAALAGERRRFAFTSYGHAYSVDAVPVCDGDGRIEAVLAVATPGRSPNAAAIAYARTAERLDRSAAGAEQRAEHHRVAGRSTAEATERRAALKAREAARRARANAGTLSPCDTAAVPEPSITSREAEVLTLASHGLTYGEIAEQLAITGATVRTHLENIYPKLGVSDKASAVAVGLRHGLID